MGIFFAINYYKKMGASTEQQIEIADDSTRKYTVVPVPKRNRNSPSQRTLGGSTLRMVNVFAVFSIALILAVTSCNAAALPDVNAVVRNFSKFLTKKKKVFLHNVFLKLPQNFLNFL